MGREYSTENIQNLGRLVAESDKARRAKGWSAAAAAIGAVVVVCAAAFVYFQSEREVREAESAAVKARSEVREEYETRVVSLEMSLADAEASRDELNAFSAISDERAAQVAALEAEIAAMSVERSQLIAALESAEAEKESTRTSILAESDEREVEMEALVRERLALIDALNAEREEKRQLQAELSETSEAVVTAKAELDAVISSQASLEARLASMERDRRALQNDVAQAAAQVEALSRRSTIVPANSQQIQQIQRSFQTINRRLAVP